MGDTFRRLYIATEETLRAEDITDTTAEKVDALFTDSRGKIERWQQVRVTRALACRSINDLVQLGYPSIDETASRNAALTLSGLTLYAEARPQLSSLGGDFLAEYAVGRWHNRILDIAADHNGRSVSPLGVHLALYGLIEQETVFEAARGMIDYYVSALDRDIRSFIRRYGFVDMHWSGSSIQVSRLDHAIKITKNALRSVGVLY